MKDIIALYVIRYGISDSLTEIAAGFAKAPEDHGWTPEGSKKVSNVSTDLYQIRNDLERGKR